MKSAFVVADADDDVADEVGVNYDVVPAAATDNSPVR